MFFNTTPVNGSEKPPYFSDIRYAPIERADELPDSIRARIIDTNLTSNRPTVFYPLLANRENSKLTTWQLLKEACAKTSQKNGWMSVAYTVSKIALSVIIIAAMVGGSLYFIISTNYNKISKYFDITTYRNGRPLYTSYNVLYTKADFYGDCITDLIFFPLLALVPCAPFIYLFKSCVKEDPLFQNFDEVKALNKKVSFIVTAELKEAGCSMEKINLTNLANEIDVTTSGYFDIISAAVIAPDEIRTPKILSIGHYAFSVDSALRAVLGKNLYPNGEIPHPIEQRCLTPHEKQKFVKDVSLLLCASEQRVASCWEVDEARITLIVDHFLCALVGVNAWSNATEESRNQLRSPQIHELKKACIREQVVNMIPASIKAKHFPEI